MYFVDRQKMEEQLQYIEKQVSLFQSNNNWESGLEKAALERIVQMLIESILDVGNSMIDGFIMRDPGSYEDIIDILLDEKVIDADMEKSLKVLVGKRKQLVQFYTSIDHSNLASELGTIIKDVSAFPKRVRDYLTSELGPVTAFTN